MKKVLVNINIFFRMIFKKMWNFIKKIAIFAFKTIIGMKTWQGILSLILSFTIFYGWAVFLIVLGVLTKQGHLTGIGTAVLAFWAGPFTPFFPIMIGFALVIQRFVFFDKSNVDRLKSLIEDNKLEREKKKQRKQELNSHKAINKILLHICCAPCAIYPLERLKEQGYDVDGLFYNPNIHPIEEFNLRKENLVKLAEMEDFKVCYMDDYEESDWTNLDNKKNRCNMCYEKRLKKLFLYARINKYHTVTTTLLVSPYQNHQLLIDKANKYSKQYKVKFYYEDFRIGFREGQKKAKELGLYCQKYCGCILSFNERLEAIKKKEELKNVNKEEKKIN